MEYRKLWIALILVLTASFAVLGGVGYHSLNNAPPIPARVVSTDGQVLFSGETIRDGQNVWQSIGGQEIGSVWGHGSYVAPDWSADWLHRESMYMLDQWAVSEGAANYASLPREEQASLRARLEGLMRTNTYDKSTDTIVVPPIRAAAFNEVARHYADVFSKGRNEYAIPHAALTDTTKLRQMATFFWWTSWAAS